MIPSVGAIALCRLGSSENAVSALLQVLQQMKYRVCSALGISDQAYSNVQDWVLGTLQGSGASPCLWLANTCVLLGAISKQSSGLTLIDPRRARSQTRSAETYVDDTELLLSMEQTPLEELAREMQGLAQFCEQLLYTTGGTLVLEKCFFVAMDRNFKNDQYTLKTKEEMQVTIALTSGAYYLSIKEIPQKDVCEGSRNLGAMLAPQGNNQDEFKKLIHTGKK